MSRKYEDSREPKLSRELSRKLAINTPYLLQCNDDGAIEVWELLEEDQDCSDPVFTGMTFASVEEAYAWACPSDGSVQIRVRYER